MQTGIASSAPPRPACKHKLWWRRRRQRPRDVGLDSIRRGDSGVRSANASVTITTAFNALAYVGQDCFLNITHVLRPGTGGGHSRVRIDSLTVSAENSMSAFGYMHARGRGHGGKSGKSGSQSFPSDD